MMTRPDPQETWQEPPPPPPRCPLCHHAMPTPAHVFLHAQQHGDGPSLAWDATAHWQSLDLLLYDRIAYLMQAYARHEQWHSYNAIDRVFDTVLDLPAEHCEGAEALLAAYEAARADIWCQRGHDYCELPTHALCLFCGVQRENLQGGTL